MKIKDLVAKQADVDVEGTITEKGDVREFSKFGKLGKVCSAKLKDSSGTIVLSLWNEQVDEYQVGDKVRVTKGYVNEWQGEKQLSSGKFGKIEKV